MTGNVKSAMSESLLEHDRAGRFAFPQPIGSLLDVDLEDGLSLRVHMDGSVSPDWAGGRTVVLGPGVVPDLSVLSSCPYVYRVRCESDGADRRVWIGTQSLARPTEWVPLSDCAWTDDGLITPPAAQILRERPAVPDRTATEAGRRSGELPQSVIRFVRGLEAAQRSGTVEHVRRLCAGSGPFLDSLDGAARAEAEQAVEEARTWLTGHEDYQQRVFAELDQAVTEKRAFDVRSQLPTATSLYPPRCQRLRAARPGRSPRLTPGARRPSRSRLGPDRAHSPHPAPAAAPQAQTLQAAGNTQVPEGAEEGGAEEGAEQRPERAASTPRGRGPGQEHPSAPRPAFPSLC
ncbi:hypothetical protein QQY66_00280 [Streptomyces sp. DG2A-72]|uniref:hypothetical protein n=1 Tax=Streptomyces sp. DG2A-72 TaxID=3051386 RepID=UPI00265C2A42|nr:hypothetical protein [Streptomyces sp. DG2A-72]MDO0930229.1 hypothetical protein [Streptomyces sp. DG2A-72]